MNEIVHSSPRTAEFEELLRGALAAWKQLTNPLQDPRQVMLHRLDPVFVKISVALAAEATP